MKIIKQGLARIASLETDRNLFDANDLFQLKKDIIRFDKDLHSNKHKSLNELHNYNLSCKNSKNFNIIQNIRRAIFNGREIKVKDIQYLKENKLFNLLDIVYQHLELIEKNKKKRIDFSKKYNSILLKKRIELFNKSKHNLFENGLLLSSPAIFEILKKDKVITSKSNKKQRKLEIGLLKYITRTMFKPTPFSSFTALNNVSFEKLPKNSSFQTQYSKEYNSFVSVNSLFFRFVKFYMKNSESIYPYLNIILNPSIREISNNFDFLINKDNLEYFQKVEINNTLITIKEIIEKNKTQTFNELLGLCLKIIDAEKELISKYLYKLIDVGFIEFNFFSSGMERDWINKVILGLKNIPNSIAKNKILELIYELEYSRINYEQKFNNSSERKEILDNTFERINTFLKDLENLTNSKDLINTKFLKKHIFLEDVKSNHTIALNNDNIESILINLSNFLFSFKDYSILTNKRTEFFDFFTREFKETKEVSLLEFYKKYYKSLKTDQETVQESRKKYINDYNIIKISEDEVKIKFLSLKKVDNNYSSSLLFQIIGEEIGKPKIVVNAIGIGYGKMFSRYLYMFNQNLTDEIINLNENLNPEKIYSEINDTSFFNANIHPSLFPHECIIPGVHANTSSRYSLNVNDLSLKVSKENSDLLLIDNKTNKQVMIHDSCFQTASSRSNLFSFLINFTDKIPASYSILLQEINNKNKFFFGLNKESFYCPRIYLNENIVLQRKFWIINEMDFPELTNNDSNFYLELNKWKLKNNIPSKVFITIDYNKSIKNKKFSFDDRKPQYIDFESPLFTSILYSFFKKVNSLKIVEASPDIYESNSYSNTKLDKKITTEFLIQWYYGKRNK